MPSPDAALLRARMVDALLARGRISTPRVESALRSVPRHLFISGSSLESSYADEAMAIKWRGDVPISSVSQPTMVASMLEMLDVPEGSTVMEIGTGSGYNAALLATLAGAGGTVVTIEVDEDLADKAAATLASSGFEAVEVHAGDGRLGWQPRAPYDRIIVTASSPTPEQSWVEQLREGGRMVVPLAEELRAVAYTKRQGELARQETCPALFIPLR
jgi:protein-L-isoaspartate(D-aspartate) O-methyltransferase